jgi:hypothetical protein
MSKNEESTGVPKLPSLTSHLEARIQLLEDALKPFAAIADEYDSDGLDEARPDWVARGIKKLDLGIELYSGRGGKELMTLQDVLRARSALTGKPYALPVVDPFIEKVKRLYAASLNNLPWEGMSEERRNTIIENYRKLEE